VHDLELYAGYTYTVAERKYLPANQFIPLTPRNRWAFVVAYAIPGKWRIGIEGSYTGSQYRDGDTKTPGYMFMAGMIERKIGKYISIVLNCENLLDKRQSKYEPLYTGPVSNPVFKPLWAPIDGRVVNLSVKWDWGKLIGKHS
jgi:iron complex outermembrane receptor protein/outer membrane receptor for ferrienterochelin and colicins